MLDFSEAKALRLQKVLAVRMSARSHRGSFVERITLVVRIDLLMRQVAVVNELLSTVTVIPGLVVLLHRAAPNPQ